MAKDRQPLSKLVPKHAGRAGSFPQNRPVQAAASRTEVRPVEIQLNAHEAAGKKHLLKL